MQAVVDTRRRRFGAMFLTVAIGMLIWGQTLLKPHLAGLDYVLYWLICLLLTIMSIIMALLDLRAIRRRTREQQRKLIEKTLDDLQDKRSQPNNRPPSKSGEPS